VEAQSAAKVSPVVDWLRDLGLAKYEEVFAREEVDWDTLQWLTEEVSLFMFITISYITI
jgi:DNA cross-link repair 1A protein